MNMLDLTWKSILKHFLSSPTIFIDILLLLETCPLCIFSQITLFRSPSHKAVEWLIEYQVSQNQIFFMLHPGNKRFWYFGGANVKLHFLFLTIRGSVSSKMRLFFLFQDKVDILI